MNNKRLYTFTAIAIIAGVAFGLRSAIPRLIEGAIGNFYFSTEILIFLVAFGLGLTIPWVIKWAIRNFSSSEILMILMKEMRNLIIYSKDNEITFDKFPYYVR